MNVEWINGATQKELDQFKAICNQLLSRTYVVKTLCRADKSRVNNPDYLFLSAHYEEVREYLYLLDWDLRWDKFNGYFYVINTDEANRCNLDKNPYSQMGADVVKREYGRKRACLLYTSPSPRDS